MPKRRKPPMHTDEHRTARIPDTEFDGIVFDRMNGIDEMSMGERLKSLSLWERVASAASRVRE